MCLNPGYVQLKSTRVLNLKSGTVNRWKLKKITEEDYYKLKEQGFINTRESKIIKTGCGKCPECRMAKADQWGVRGYLETITQPAGVFVTLTYNTANLPSTENLEKRDTQLFKKRLRKQSKLKLKMLESGEYGELNGRPHYHMIIWGMELPKDIREVKVNSGYTAYQSMWLEKIWGKGIVTISPISFKNIRYTARYTAKKINEKIKDKEIKPYIIASNGISKQYWIENKQKILEDGNILIWDSKKGTQVKEIPKYFKRLYDEERYRLKEGITGEFKRLVDKIRRKYGTEEWKYKWRIQREWRNKYLNRIEGAKLPEVLTDKEAQELQKKTIDKIIKNKRERLEIKINEIKQGFKKIKGYDEISRKQEEVKEWTPIEIHEMQVAQARQITKQRLLKEGKQTEKEYDQKSTDKRTDNALYVLKYRNVI